MTGRSWPVLAGGALALSALSCAAATPLPRAPEKCPSQAVTVQVLASPRTNPSPQGEALSVVVRVYQLKADARLLNASFDAVWNDAKTTLGDDLVKVDELIVYPSSRTDVKFERGDAVHHIAAVALFQNPKGRSWYSMLDLPPVPQPGKCGESACLDEDCDSRAVQNPVFAFWIDGSKIDDGVEHMDEFPKAGRATALPRKAPMPKASEGRRP